MIHLQCSIIYLFLLEIVNGLEKYTQLFEITLMSGQLPNVFFEPEITYVNVSNLNKVLLDIFRFIYYS